MIGKILFTYTGVLLMAGTLDVHHYVLAGFGWLLYVVGRLYFTRDKYDKDHDGLSPKEVLAYLKKNWIGFLFNAMLLIVLVPYTQDLWEILVNDWWGKEWEFTDFAYVLSGSGILFVQILIDIVQWKLGKLKS